MSQLDKLISRLGELAGGAPRTHAGIRFDSATGIGGVPDAANADYRGFTAYMRPDTFLQVNPPRDLGERPIDHILEAIDSGESIGTPILYVDRRPDNSWQVRGHEGRGRMMALEQRHPNALFPVAVSPNGGVRARDLTPEDALAWMRQDRGGSAPGRGVVSILGGKAHIQPRDIEFYHQYGLNPALEDLLRELGHQP